MSDISPIQRTIEQFLGDEVDDKPVEREYRVTWAIDILATCPEQAAVRAENIAREQVNRRTQAGVFTVCDGDGIGINVDLSIEPDSTFAHDYIRPAVHHVGGDIVITPDDQAGSASPHFVLLMLFRDVDDNYFALEAGAVDAYVSQHGDAICINNPYTGDALVIDNTHGRPRP